MLIERAQISAAYDSIRARSVGRGSSIVIFVSQTPDSLCACHVLTGLFRSDHLQYKIIPVSGYPDLESQFNSFVTQNDEVRSAVLLNCGSMVPLEEMLKPGPEVVIYVIDSHRPYHLANVNPLNEQIQLLDGAREPERYPDYRASDYAGGEEEEDEEDTAADMDADEEDEPSEEEEEEEHAEGDAEGEEGGVVAGSRKRGSGASSREKYFRRLKKQKAREDREREKERKKVERRAMLEEYYRSAYFGCPVAVLAYELASQVSKETNEMLWMAIVGLTDHLIHERTDDARYAEEYSDLLLRVAHFNPSIDEDNWVRARMDANKKAAKNGSRASRDRAAASGADKENVDPVDEEKARQMRELKAGLADPAAEDDEYSIISGLQMKPSGHIEQIEEYRFMLLRRWDLYNSMYHSPYVATRLQLWKSKGKRLLDTFLAKMGMPLDECKKDWSFMSVASRRRLNAQLAAYAPKFRMNSSIFRSFQIQTMGQSPLSASDLVYALSALLEHGHTEQQKATASDGDRSSSTDEKEAKAVDGDAADGEADWQKNFWTAYSAATGKSLDVLEMGLRLARTLQVAMVRQGIALLEKKSVNTGGVFRYTIIDDSPDLHLFAQPLTLSRLGLFLADLFRERHRKSLPFVISALCKTRDTYLIVGVPEAPSFGLVGKSSFGNAFAQCTEKVFARVKHDGFETSTMEIQKDDLHKFMEILHSGLIEI